MIICGIPTKELSTVREYHVAVEGNKALYINIADINNIDGDANSSWLISSMHIYVNDEPVLIPTLGDVKIQPILQITITI